MRYIVENARTKEIIDRDLDVSEAQVVGNLSGPCQIDLTVPWRGANSDFTKFEPWGHLIHVEETIMGQRRIIATGIVQPSEVDEATGDLKLVADGYSNYPKDIPWLQNWNPIVVDPFEIFTKVWDHLQSYPDGDLGVDITPKTSGTFMLPGFSFDGNELVLDFFAFFLRSADLRDCADVINGLARDIPFDYIETAEWNAGRTRIDKTIKLGYPRLGLHQQGMVFRFGENVISGKPRPTTDTEWASSIIVKGWFPGKMYSSDFTNDDSNRLRRVIKQDDISINSKERAAVWAKRKLTRRQVPDYWDELQIDPSHPNAPFGQWNLGDEVLVEGYMPWVGRVSALHRIIGWGWDGIGPMTIKLKHEGAFNYDPIMFEG